jgi:nitronate monooxygenase
MGIVQPLSLAVVHGRDFREGMRRIRSLTSRPVGLNVLTEKSLSRVYQKRMEAYVDAALEEGVRFFVTALGNPRWVVDRVRPHGGVVYHDVVDRKWGLKGLEGGVDGLICVNNRAGGHAGSRDPEALFGEMADLGVPLVCAGGVGDEQAFARALRIGYAGVQMGTRFIATEECRVPASYKEAILAAGEDDIVLTERVTGVSLAVIRNEYIDRVGTKAGPIGRLLLRGRKTKHLMRAIYSVRSFWQLKRALEEGKSTKDCWQAGKSVAGITAIEPAGAIVRRFALAAP